MPFDKPPRPPKPYSFDANNSYEERLHDVEDDNFDVKIKLAEHSFKLDNLSEAMKQGAVSMKEGFSSIEKMLSPMSEKLKDHDDFINEALESKKNRKQFWLKVLAPVLSAIFSAAGVYIWHCMTAVHHP